MIFVGRKKLASTMNKIIKYFPDDEIKMRFVEKDPVYEFVLYCQSRILLTTSVFLKSLKISEHYKDFREIYDVELVLKFELIIQKKDNYKFKLLNYKKKFTFLIVTLRTSTTDFNGTIKLF